VLHSDEYFLSMVQGARAFPARSRAAGAALTGKDIIGFRQYNDLDPRWLGTLWSRITRTRVAFLGPPTDFELVSKMARSTTIAMAGDWGAGNDIAKAVGAQIAARKADYTIHLGDVYYSGTDDEEKTNFVDLWPAGSVASYALNSNHEMYSGGHGYFGIALTDQKFQAQRDRSYFALANDDWLVIGLDSAYAAQDFLYQTGFIQEPQIAWIKSIVAKYGSRGDGSPKRIIVLTHHEPIEYDGKQVNPLLSQVVGAIGRAPDFWYWGHVHGVAEFNAVPLARGQMLGRCVGHGAVPYERDPMTPALVWTEDTLAKDAASPSRALNGFVVLTFDGPNLNEEFWSELGVVRRCNSF
jgi:hypothetical protein